MQWVTTGTQHDPHPNTYRQRDMTDAQKSALKALWPVTSQRPLRAKRSGPRKVTLDGLVSDGLAYVVRGGYVLTKAGHNEAIAVIRGQET